MAGTTTSDAAEARSGATTEAETTNKTKAVDSGQQQQLQHRHVINHNQQPNQQRQPSSFTFPVESWSDIRYLDNGGRAFSRRDLLSYKKVLFVFGANWCPVSKIYLTQTLPEHYKMIKQCRGESALQIVYVSHDETSVAFARFFQTMPWLSIPYRDVECASRLKLLFEVSSIPRVVALDTQTVSVICSDARKRFGVGADALDGYDELSVLASGGEKVF